MRKGKLFIPQGILKENLIYHENNSMVGLKERKLIVRGLVVIITILKNTYKNSRSGETDGDGTKGGRNAK